MGLLVYKRFSDLQKAEAVARILGDNAIEVEVTSDRESLDSLYGDKHFTQQHFIKIDGNDFGKADTILTALSEEVVSTADKDHYLYEFTDEELFDILSKPDEWNEFDVQLSKQILRERGKEINQHTIDLLKKQRISELAKPEEGQRTWIYAGYLFAFLGGIIGVFIGWHLSTYRKTLPNGQQVHAYAEADRKSGRRIYIIGIIMLIIWITARVSGVLAGG